MKPIGAAVLCVLAGCSVAQTVVDLPGSAVQAIVPGSGTPEPPDPVKLQERMLRFADEYETEMVLTLDRLPRGEAPLDAKTILQLKWILSSAVIGMASGANPRAGLLDLTAFASVTRMAVETHWLPRPFGETVHPLYAAAGRGEDRAWTLAAQILTAEQRDRFRADILAWFQAHPRPESIFAARSAGLAEEAVLQGDETKGSGRFITIDPFSNLDPAVREITQARMLGERTLFVADRLPRQALWQSELLAMSLLETSALKQVVANADQLSGVAQRVAAIAEKLPEQLSKEREEILKTLRPLMTDTKETLDAGTRLSESAQGTLKAVDGLLAKLEVGKEKPPPPADAEPFRIKDYGETALRLEAAVQRTTELVGALDRLLGSPSLDNLAKQVSPAVERAESGAKGLVDYIVARLAFLVILVLGAALFYRRLAARMAAQK